MRRLKSTLLLLVATLFVTAAAWAQSTNGTISGKVLDSQRLPVPGVTVTAQSPSLQGDRITVSSENGDYIFPLLPSGTYSLIFEISGFETTRRTVTLAPTQGTTLDVELGLNNLQETVNVTASSAEVLTRTSQFAANYKQDLIANLPTTRDVTSSLLLAPSVHPTGPGGNFTISGAPSFESAYLVNGVTATENIRGQIQPNLMIEDAIQETTIASAGISAEFGRFTGGVVNVITKSGGNDFSGSLRDTLNNDDWRALVPSRPGDLFTTDSKIDDVVPAYEYTLGGPVLKDRIWFFTAGRAQTQKAERQLVVTNFPYTFTNKFRRYEGKGTFAINSAHRVQAAYNKVVNDQFNYVSQQGFAMDPRMLQDRQLPEQLLTMDYTGVFGQNWFVEARFSGRDLTIIGSGAKSTDLIYGTQITDSSGRMSWTDLFCGVCDNESRDNRDVFAKVNYFLSTADYGAHQMVAGVDSFNDQRFANNHQFGSDHQILNGGSIVRGTTVYPVFNAQTLIRWRPIFLLTQGSNFRTHSLFFNDVWSLNGRLTANLGVRWDKNNGRNGADELVSTAGAFSPRLGVTWDPTGGQKWAITASFSKYTAGLLNSIADSTSAGGNPERYDFAYAGPAINADPNGVLLPTDQALTQLFAWFNTEPGYNRPIVGTPAVRGVSARVGNLESPNVFEYAFGVNRSFGSRASFRSDFIYRNFNDFYAARTDMTTGRVTDTRSYAPPAMIGRTYDLMIIGNSNVYERQYTGLTSLATYRFGTMVETGVSYTLSRLWGNVDAENISAGPLANDLEVYPEYKRAEWYAPDGDLAADQRHRARFWATYLVPGRLRGLTLGAIQTVESGVQYGAVSTNSVDVRPSVTNPGYLTPPAASQMTYYFTPRDAFHTEGQRRTDFAATYTRAIPGTRGLELFGQLQLINVFNQFQLCACGNTVFSNGGTINVTQTIDTTVRTPATTSSYQTFNPLTTTPVEGVNWALGPNFGHAVNRMAYTTPRTMRLSFGIRF